MSQLTGPQLILFLVPLFVILIAGEWLYFRSKSKKVYSSGDTMANLACGAGQTIIDGLVLVTLLQVYQSLQTWLGVSAVSLTFNQAFLTFVAVDFSYYVYHRMSHRFSWMWAVHVVHHSSQNYNFSVGLRQAWFHKLTAFPFYLVFALVGVPVVTLGIIVAIHASLQILTHTQAIPKEIPWLRWVFVTPSHHRVHHGSQPQYIDKNFAAIFSFWDRIFKTYEPEVEPVIYGVRPQMNSLNPWTINTHGWRDLFSKTKSGQHQAQQSNFSFKSVASFLILFSGTVVYLSFKNQIPTGLSLTIGLLLLLLYALWGRINDSSYQNN